MALALTSEWVGQGKDSGVAKSMSGILALGAKKAGVKTLTSEPTAQLRIGLMFAVSTSHEERVR